VRVDSAVGDPEHAFAAAVMPSSPRPREGHHREETIASKSPLFSWSTFRIRLRRIC